MALFRRSRNLGTHEYLSLDIAETVVECWVTFVYVECGIKSDELSKPHGANSFIHILVFYANRQKRIGGVATTSRSLITH